MDEVLDKNIDVENEITDNEKIDVEATDLFFEDEEIDGFDEVKED